MELEDVLAESKLNRFGKETILQFIQTKIKQNENFKQILTDTIEVEDDITVGDITMTRSSRGFYYERLWDVCIKFGVSNLTLPSMNAKLQTSHIIGENTNTSTVYFQENCWTGNKLQGYLQQKVRSGNSGGYSDITFINKPLRNLLPDDHTNEELCFVSVKYFEREKDIGEYDIGKLCTLIRQHETQNRTIKIFIFVNNKQKAIEKFKSQNASSNILIKYISPNGNYENVLDSSDLQESYFKLRKLLEQYNYFADSADVTNFESTYLNVLKSLFIPRFHQRLFIRNTTRLITEKHKTNILVGAIPRSGKSYIMAGIILECVKMNPQKKHTFLIMTPAPNETFPEYESMFSNYVDFERFGIEVIKHSDKVSLTDLCRNPNGHCVILISKQKLGWNGTPYDKILNNDEDVAEIDNDYAEPTAGKKDAEIENIKKRVATLLGSSVNIDYMFLDEAHFGMSTEKAQNIVSTLNSVTKRTVKIYVTATYNKPLQVYGIEPECKITWDINDINIMKNLTAETILDNPIAERFKGVYRDTLEYFGDKSGKLLIAKLKNEYAIYPKPYLITSLWDKDFLNVERLKIGETEFGWDMGKLFATNGDDFANREQIKEIMRYYFGYPDKKEDYNKQAFYRNRGILPRIQRICTNNCRTLQTGHKTTQLWFLPLNGSVGDTIDKKSNALVRLFFDTNEFKDIKHSYHFFVAVDVKDSAKIKHSGVTYMKNPKQIKKDIEELEAQIKNGNLKADNLIILAGQRLQLGISLRNVDIVTLWNSTMSDDALFQMLFRSMTEVDSPSCVENEYCDKKKFGFMVDMNPQRAITNVSMFNVNMTKQKGVPLETEYRQITDLINIDEDVFLDKYDGNQRKKDEFARELFSKLYGAWNVNTENIRKIINKFEFDVDELQKLKGILSKINATKDGPNVTDIVDVPDDEMVLPGKKQEKRKPETKEKKKEKEQSDEVNLQLHASETIAEFISLLNIFTLYSDEGSKCILNGNSKPDQIKIVSDVLKLKEEIFDDIFRKEMFLKIINGRLTGKSDEEFPEEYIDGVLNALTNGSQKMQLNKIVLTQKQQYYTINEPDKLLEFINGELKPKEKEKKENGEVFTPISLVIEMVDKLDEVYTKEHGRSIFSEKDFKWFDPAVGIGNFPIVVYQRLMVGLSGQITNEESRRKWILEHMLYSAELTPKNVFIYRKIFCGDSYRLNVYEGDTLKMDMKSEFRLPVDFQGFDVILGNPPYQQQVGPKKTETLWDKFIKFSLKLLKMDRFLVYVNPPGWRNIDGNFKYIQTDFLSRNLKYLEIHNEKDGLKIFSSSTRYDWYVLQNNFSNKPTIVKFQDGTTKNIDLNGLEFIPNGEYDKFMSIIAKPSEEKVSVIYSRSLYGTDKKHMSRTETKELYKYPCVYTVNSKGIPTFFYSSVQHGHFGEPKVIWSNGGNPGSYVDIRGEYGLTQFAYAIVDEPKNLQKIKQAFDSKDFRDLMELSTFGQGHINYKIVSILKKDFWKLFLDGSAYKINEIEQGTNLNSPVSTSSGESKKRSSKISIPSASSKSKRKTKKQPVQKKTPSPISPTSGTPPGKIYNPLTKRFLNDTKANRKKIGLLGGNHRKTYKKQ